MIRALARRTRRPTRYPVTAVSVMQQVLVEPGRLLVANAGILLSRVLLRKEGRRGRKFVVIDAGMNDLMRPALYQAHHEIEPVARRRGPALRRALDCL